MAPSRSPPPSSRLLGPVSRFWHKSYAPDYLGFSLLLISYILIQFFVEPFHRMFSVNDLRISFPFAQVERVPLALDFVYVLFVPLALMVAYNLASRAALHKQHVTVLGLAIALILTAFLTDVVKNMVGRARPDLLARCMPDPKLLRDAPGPLVSINVCTQKHHHTLHDGWRSFPSGHSSFSFAGLGYLSLFLAGQMRIFAHGAGDGDAGDGSRAPTIGEHTEKLVRGDLMRALLCLAPLLGATMIAISRCQDYRHDVEDVCVGAILGSVVAYWSYRRYWPRLSSSRCAEPYVNPPGSEAVAARYGRVRDEEEGAGPGQNVGFGLDEFNRP
ncbi:phosphatidic acid phosphatase type 2/haloperoxidase [Lasiosphaeria miniovina]|uniref:Phosphatidic acid phosphatase type 2/haloperoxidase n=1 Tax=Lasiosphaeria miniovina TaxID=1954250 RepID=A0AA40A6K0_9PEZI|nr:phosphatidic acid phosphatase type 2/haloperoxidase [Lasiosphaeria miniovina]KAK0710098.1 phosphatidic acid phosphatase type 2/haloperoxidase [Lasiosphaeria miniovina]